MNEIDLRRRIAERKGIREAAEALTAIAKWSKSSATLSAMTAAQIGLLGAFMDNFEDRLDLQQRTMDRIAERLDQLTEHLPRRT